MLSQPQSNPETKDAKSRRGNLFENPAVVEALKHRYNRARLGTSRPWGSGLVYGGDARQSRTGVRVVPVAEMTSLYPDPGAD